MLGGLDPTTFSIIIGVMSALLITLLIVALVPSAGAQRYARRLRQISTRRREASADVDAVRSLARRESTTPGIDRIFARVVPRRQILVERLAKTGRSISVGQYMLVTVALALAFSLVIFIFARLSIVPSLMFGLAVGAFIPHFVVGFLGKRRIKRFVALFPEAIDLMVRALRAGLPISEAIINAGDEIGDPVGTEFRGIEAGMRLGRDLESLLWEIAKRIDVSEFRFFIIALSVQRETGGNLAETLNNLSEVLRRRRAMRAKVRAMASEARASTAILGGLPVVVALVLLVMSPTYISPLFTDVRGLAICGGAVLMLITGITIMIRMGKFEI
ncbi:MAG TPA: type II secretion system F family protein [Stellaceae bacterium]|nr:type II secretion system F family protein [Stellaceae bacterium]